ncbi:unnamed protein product, partial [Meganyctiphanes norvegica]
INPHSSSIHHKTICHCGPKLFILKNYLTKNKNIYSKTVKIIRMFFQYVISLSNGFWQPNGCKTFCCCDGHGSRWLTMAAAIGRMCASSFRYLNAPCFRHAPELTEAWDSFPALGFGLLPQLPSCAACVLYGYAWAFCCCLPTSFGASATAPVMHVTALACVPLVTPAPYARPFYVGDTAHGGTHGSLSAPLSPTPRCAAARSHCASSGRPPPRTTCASCRPLMCFEGYLALPCHLPVFGWRACTCHLPSSLRLCGLGLMHLGMSGSPSVCPPSLFGPGHLLGLYPGWPACNQLCNKDPVKLLSCDDISTFGEYEKMCADNIQNLDMTDTERRDTIESCAFDMCVVFNSGSTDPSPQDWLDRIKQSAGRQIAINIATPRNPNLEWNTVDSDLFVRFDRQEYWNDARAVCQEFGLELYQPRNPMAVAIYLKDKYGDWRSRYWLGARGNGTHMAWLSGDVLTLDNPYLMWRDVRKNPNQCTGLQANNKEKNKVLYASWGCSVWKYYTLCG